VNYFGHAAVAGWFATPATRGAIAFGAMLPDFAAMASVRLGDHAGDIGAGIDFHHRTDAVFHRMPVVSGLMRDLFDRLIAGGVARGPSRAVSHVGVELLLDGVLIDDESHRAAYLDALAVEPVPDGLDTLVTRLRGFGVPWDLQRPDAVAHRIARVTADRPLLAARGDEPARIRRILSDYRDRVVVASDAIVRGLRASLFLV
jgi:hypothetical protein